MEAIKQYVCGVCSCLFGCMTAEHFCPLCNKRFDYDPADYHCQIICGNDCKGTFGFYYFDVSDRRYEEVRREAKVLAEQAAKNRSQRHCRAQRFNQRAETSSVAEVRTSSAEELLFKKGLIEYCPRCGIAVADLLQETSTRPQKIAVDDVPSIHLKNCSDAEQVAAYQRRRQFAKEKRRSLQAKEIRQEDAQVFKAWELQGRQVGQLWMLSENTLRSQCASNGVSDVDAKGNPLGKVNLITRLASHFRSVENNSNNKAPALISWL
ncbi:uncharacterized protein LOC135122434 [Zophobas morio]|uniref:uncharacterized protein LOC135122434 n=1 Tax=Zophobas morio TaxID=2755281 RepID=UPI003082C3DE